jgi:hypothetical protein
VRTIDPVSSENDFGGIVGAGGYVHDAMDLHLFVQCSSES